TNKDKFEGNVAFKDSLMFLREQFEISRFLENEGLAYDYKNGSHIHITKAGHGKSIEDGLEVTMSYKAYFTSGTKFDDTDEWKDTLKFIYGVPFQIILGLEISLEGLKSGTEAKLIIPSQLAFGKDGSSSGIVPPFEPIIYEIKILSVIELES
ncbi:MAG TPA: FKBP-type peptidyl-prolyl cis-trans isomerase, partial [Ignavibacteriaceae bacterium]